MTRDYEPLLAEAATDGLAVLAEDVIVAANSSFATLCGRPEARLLERRILDIVPEPFHAPLRSLLADRKSAAVHVTVPEGTTYDVRWRPVSDQTPSLGVVSFHDVSELVQARAELTRAETYLDAAQSHARLGIWEYEPRTGSGRWSPELYRLYDRDVSEGVPSMEEFFGLLHPDDVERVQVAQRNSLNGTDATVEFRTNPTRGPVRYLAGTVHSTVDEGGEIVRLIGSVQDITARHEAEQAIRDREQRYRHLFENTPIGLGVADANGVIIACNDAMLVPGDYRREDLAGIATVADLYADPAERDAVLEVLGREGQVREREVTFKRRDGSTYDASLSLNPVTIDGQPCVLAMVEDVTRRKAAQRDLAASESRFRALIEYSYDVIALFGADRTITYISPSVERVLGYRADELVGRPAVHLIHPDDVALAGRQVAEALERPGEVFHLWRRLRHADGSYRTMQVTGRNLLHDPNVRALVSNLRDVTEHQRIEDELHRSEAQYRALFEQATFGIFQAAPDGTFRTVNPALVRLLGYDRSEDVLALADLGAIYAEPDQWNGLVDQATDGAAVSAEVTWRRRDAELITVRLNGRAVRDAGGDIAGFDLIGEDVTHQRALEDQLRHAQKMEAVGELTGGIAHDFNNLLTTVLGSAELLEQNIPAADAEARADLDRIRMAAIRGADMIKKLLAFSRKEGLRFEAIDLRALGEDMRQMLPRVLPETVRVAFRAGEPIPAVRADRGAVQQILLNLATNARDAMPEGGHLTLAVEPMRIDPAFRLARGFGEPGDYVRLGMTDTGIGMNDATRRRVFDPFYTTKPVGEGTGLGMSMVYGLVKQHNGYVEVESEPAHGTTVSVYLPVTDAPEPAAAPPAEPIVPRGGQERILLVEDARAVRELGQRALADAGYDVVTAGDGHEALAVLQQQPEHFDLVITDVVMPKLGGRELYREAARSGCRARFIFTSGYSDDTHGTSDPESLGGPFLSKPWSPSDLRRCVRTTLDRPPA